MATTAEYLLGLEFGIDQVLIPDDPNPVSTAIRGRMALQTALLFLAIALILLLKDFARKSAIVLWITESLNLLVVLCALAAVANYLFGGVSGHRSEPTNTIAYHTAFAFLLMGVGLFFAEPERGLAQIFSRDDLGGMLARRLMPIVLILPILLGWLRYLGQEAGLYASVQGIMASALMYVVLFSVVVLASAAAISRIEARRRKAEEIQERVFTMSQDLMCVANFQGYFLRVNAAFEQAMGYTAAELTARPYLDFIHPDDQGKTSSEADRNASAHSTVKFENRYIRKDGTPIFLTWSATPYPAEGLIFGSARDITDQKKREAEIRSLNARLTGKIGELSAANHELEAFTYSVSHDLRAPLRHIDGYIELLNRETADKLDEKCRRYLDTIESSAKQMGRLIDGLLNFSRMGRASLSYGPVDSSALVEELVAAQRALSGAQEVHWQVGSLPPVQADRTMLRQVWSNLIENSLKYSRTRPIPEIEIGGRIEDNQAVFYIRDNGVGFDPQYAHKLFGVFQRLHSAREFEGTGIGLANVQRIVTRHAGRVWAEGKVDAGATFYFSLPCDSKSPQPVQPKEPAPA
ncbi:MAG TPA: ATP-binding protein [Planctomycetota bacterium]|nr:ATP-binding protein [Planctomycetota bacterium]